MNVTLVEINIKPERVDEFLEVFRANHEGALQEPGNLRFDVLQDPEVKTRFFIYEAYIDDEAGAGAQENPALSGLRREAGGADVEAAAEAQLYRPAAGGVRLSPHANLCYGIA
ncbi:Autoinducer 2 (AI-2) modifying protein LsrG [Klebsiella grimontii]|uniref:Autoinducer 2 (AI-2) modifying protein LsrG n=2 Tax=Klebsiella TaxID=570 RepID=A0A7H4NWB9_9ENTR|nr:Autoinducer 2 (AI-2) modifying protein LsrG [Klebsiella grimontii]